MNDIYQALDGQLQDPAPLTSALKKSLVRLNMVFSIGSIKLFRENILVLHPFGFFTAALEAYPPTQSSFNTIEDIENFLLIALFGLYFDIGKALNCETEKKEELTLSRLFYMGAWSTLHPDMYRTQTPSSILKPCPVARACREMSTSILGELHYRPPLIVYSRPPVRYR